MKSLDKVTKQLNQILDKGQVLTDLEDLYVYSFEKIFLNQSFVKPDIVIRSSSIEEEKMIRRLARKEEIILIERGVNSLSLSTLGKSLKPIILLDNIEIPKLVTCSEKSQEAESSVNLHKYFRKAYGSYKNLALAVQNFLLGKTLNKCQECKICTGYCTVNQSFNGIETWSSKGRLLIIRGIMRGDLKFSEKIANIVYSCTKCGLCFAQCFQNLELHEAILYLRNQLAKKGLAPQIFHQTNENILKYGDPSAIPPNRRLTKLKNYSRLNLKAQTENLVWLGCTVATRTPKTAQSLINILNQMKLDYGTLGNDEGCCGYVLISAGLWEESKKVAEEVVERVKRTGAKTLITPCSGCYYTFTRLYPEILNIQMPCNILHTSQFLENAIENEKVNLNPLKINVTYHDPCSLGRHSQVYDPPREVLKAIPGLNLIEMSLNKNCARCCGGGGGLWSYNNKASLESTQTRLKEDLPEDVNILTTACPQCQINFRFASHAKNSIKKSLKICDITDLFELAMQIE